MASSFAPKENETTKAGLKMQEFVIQLSKYARSFNPDFVVIPQNGAELAFNKLNPGGPTYKAYIDAIDGVAVEDLFYNQKVKTDNYRLNMLRKLSGSEKILVSDFIPIEKHIPTVTEKCQKEKFLFFPRTAKNEYYKVIPEMVPNENADNITKLSEAKNYLYLLNPSQFHNKTHFINEVCLTNFDMVLIDLFYDGKPLTPQEIQKLKVKANGGKRLLICYINVGAVENWRYYWKKDWKLNDPTWIKKEYAGYENEFYVQFWHDDWQKIIYGNEDSYLKQIVDAGFDGAFLDNVEAFYFLYNK